MINATYFTYDGVYSGTYGLQIAEFDASAVEENPAFSPTLTTLKVPGALRMYHGGIDYSATPTCEFTVISETEIAPESRSRILSWLIGKPTFRPLRFHNNDWQDYVYYCVFTNSSTVYVNGVCHGFKLTASFDSQFARGPSTTLDLSIKTENNTLVDNGSGEILNKSDYYGYVYPEIRLFITRNSNTSNIIQIKNTTDNVNRVFQYAVPHTISGTAYELNTIYCESRRIVSQNLTVNPMSRVKAFGWPRLLSTTSHSSALNEIELSIVGDGSSASSIDVECTITCPYYAMIGY